MILKVKERLKTRTCLEEVDFHSSRTEQARDTDTHSRLPGCIGEFQTHPETGMVFVQKSIQ